MKEEKKVEVKLRELKIEQFAGLRMLHIINPDPHLVKIAGPNRAGKSSGRKAIELAHAGKGAKAPADPVNDQEGADVAKLYFDWTAFDVSCRVDLAGNKKIEVKDPEGVKQAGPQGLLNRMLGDMWRPQEFLAKSPAEQLKIVDSLTSQDWRTERDEIEADYQTAYKFRTAKNSARDNLGKLDRVEEATRVNVDELNTKIKAAREHNQAEQGKLSSFIAENSDREKAIFQAQRGVLSADTELDRLRLRLDELIKDRASEQAALDALPEIETTPPALDLQPLEAMEEEYSKASATNEAAGAYERYLEDLAKRKAAVQAAEAADVKVKQLEKAKASHAKEATLPEGLEVKDKGLYYNGRATGSMSRSEGSEFACSIAAAKGAKFMVLDDAEQFDDLSHLYEMAVKYKLQIFAFLLGDGKEDSGREVIHLYMGEEFKGEVDAKGYPVIKDGEATGQVFVHTEPEERTAYLVDGEEVSEEEYNAAQDNDDADF